MSQKGLSGRKCSAVVIGLTFTTALNAIKGVLSGGRYKEHVNSLILLGPSSRTPFSNSDNTYSIPITTKLRRPPSMKITTIFSLPAFACLAFASPNPNPLTLGARAPSPVTRLPASSGVSSAAAAITVASSFDGGMRRFERSCKPNLPPSTFQLHPSSAAAHSPNPEPYSN